MASNSTVDKENLVSPAPRMIENNEFDSPINPDITASDTKKRSYGISDELAARI